MKSLLLMRHAKSSWERDELPDFDRPLKERGRKAARRMAHLLRELHHVPELILSSSAARTRETVSLMLPIFPSEPIVITLDELYHASPGDIVRALRDVGDDVSAVLLVGHNPGLEELAFEWTGDFVAFATASIARFLVAEASWSELATDTPREMVEFWKPKDLPDEDTPYLEPLE